MDASLRALCDAKDGEMYKMQCEIERLRDELAEVDGARVLNANALRLAKEEIERLRGLIQLLNRSRPDAELARLRGLLREGLEHHDEYNWQQRVLEALGE